jgi:hypothetical protein
MNGFPTTRVYPRTMHGANGAFPRSAEYAAALIVQTRRVPRIPWLLAVALVLILAGLLTKVAS